MIELTEKDLRSYHERFYVYAYLDPRKSGKYSYDGLDICFLFEPFYIGKGHGNRYQQHICEANSNFPQSKNKMKLNKIRKIINDTNHSPFIEKIYQNILEVTSFKKEIELITAIDINTGPLTNLTNGGEGAVGVVITDEYREKMSIAIKNRKWVPTDEYLEKLRKASSGRRHTEETKNKLSEIKKGKKLSIEQREKIKIASIGRKHSEETKKKLRDISIGRKHSEETKKKLSEIKTGSILSEEVRLKMSMSRKGFSHTEEAKKKISDAQKGISKCKGKTNPRSKIWTLINEQKQEFIVEDLVGFCKDNELQYHSIKETLKHPHRQSHKGWKVISRKEKIDKSYKSVAAASETSDLTHFVKVT